MIMPRLSRYFDPPCPLVYLRGEEEEGHIPLAVNEALSLFGATVRPAHHKRTHSSPSNAPWGSGGHVQMQLEILKDHYDHNKVWQRVFEAPPVKRLFAIYGSFLVRVQAPVHSLFVLFLMTYVSDVATLRHASVCQVSILTRRCSTAMRVTRRETSPSIKGWLPFQRSKRGRRGRTPSVR